MDDGKLIWAALCAGLFKECIRHAMELCLFVEQKRNL